MRKLSSLTDNQAITEKKISVQKQNYHRKMQKFWFVFLSRRRVCWSFRRVTAFGVPPLFPCVWLWRWCHQGVMHRCHSNDTSLQWEAASAAEEKTSGAESLQSTNRSLPIHRPVLKLMWDHSTTSSASYCFHTEMYRLIISKSGYVIYHINFASSSWNKPVIL